MYFKVEEISHNGYWCSCCQSLDRHTDVCEYNSLEDLVDRFPKSLEVWEKRQAHYSVIELNAYNLDGDLLAGWKAHHESHKTNMKRIKYFMWFVGDKKEWDIYLDNKKADQPLELVDLHRRRDFKEQKLTRKEKELGNIREQINKIDEKIIEFHNKNSNDIFIGKRVSYAPVVDS
jgi:chromatin segregation and condensation protein Rec8/ScpA/Scc1 (kleisin family)